jgi:hypothetical protein
MAPVEALRLSPNHHAPHVTRPPKAAIPHKMSVASSACVIIPPHHPRNSPVLPSSVLMDHHHVPGNDSKFASGSRAGAGRPARAPARGSARRVETESAARRALPAPSYR